MIQVWDRPSNKAVGVSFEYTPEQIEARRQFAASFVESLSAPGVLESLGAYVTPSENGKTNMVALTLPIPGIKFENPDGETETTRVSVLNLNANILVEKPTEASSTHVPVQALTYAELQARSAERRKAAKQK